MKHEDASRGQPTRNSFQSSVKHNSGGATMTTEVAVPATPGIPVKRNIDIQISVNQDHCTAPKYISKLDNTWARTSILSIVTHAAAHFQDAPLAVGRSDTTNERMRQAWSRLCDFQLRAESDGKRKRLVITPGNNTDVRAEMSQLLGIGLGLAIICKKLNVPYASIVKKNYSPKVFHDFDAVHKSKLIKLEVRGRYRQNNRSNALQQVKNKFSKERDFSQAIAAQVYPFDSAHRSAPDVELVDPEGIGTSLSLGDLSRMVLWHYLPYIERQNVDGAILLRMLLNLPDDRYPDFFRTTWKLLWDAVLKSEARQPRMLGRVTMRCMGDVYMGTIYNDWAAPPWAADFIDSSSPGFVFMGLPLTILSAFGKLENTVQLLENQPESISHRDGLVYARISDGFLLIWSPTLDALMNHE